MYIADFQDYMTPMFNVGTASRWACPWYYTLSPYVTNAVTYGTSMEGHTFAKMKCGAMPRPNTLSHMPLCYAPTACNDKFLGDATYRFGAHGHIAAQTGSYKGQPFLPTIHHITNPSAMASFMEAYTSGTGIYAIPSMVYNNIYSISPTSALSFNGKLVHISNVHGSGTNLLMCDGHAETRKLPETTIEDSSAGATLAKSTLDFFWFNW